MPKWVIRWIINAMALIGIAYIVPDIEMPNFMVAFIAAIVIGLANLLVKPILVVLTLPVTILTLGLFIFVINGLLFWGVGNFLQGFEVHTFKAGMIGALAYSISTWLLTAIVIEKED